MAFDEPTKLFKPFPLAQITLAGVDGLLYPLRDRLETAMQDDFEEYLNYHFACCEEPSLIGHSMHGL